LKQALMMAPVLQLPEFNKQFVIECDASGSGFGAVLQQGNGPIAFFSHPVAVHHAKLPAYERELIVLVKAVRHWCPYVWGRFFTIRTDHFSFKCILDQCLTTIPQHTWVNKLFGYDFAVEYRHGKFNVVTDALSRRNEDDMAVQAISSLSFILYDQLRVEMTALPQTSQLRTQLTTWIAPSGWLEKDGLLLFQGCIFLPDDSTLWPMVLEQAHTMGHEWNEKTLHRFPAMFYSPLAQCRIREFVQHCEFCQRNKTEHLHPVDLLQPLPAPGQVWSDIAMDFMEALPKVDGKFVILIVVDHFSKMAHFIPLSHPYSAISVAKAFFDGIVRLHDLPCLIVSDRDPIFTSRFWVELF
jgi:hypothetical protein